MREAVTHKGLVGEAVGRGPALSVTNLTYDVGARRLIDTLNLSLPGSGVTVIMGPNGAGKSLFLRLVHGLLNPSAGSVRWGGVPLGAPTSPHQALVFQSPVLLRRSVAANLDFVLRAKGRADTDRRDALLSHVGLLAVARTPARRLSGGERQRLQLARALATDPEVLLMDEPTASLDPSSTAAIEELVHDVSRRGVKIIYVTHDLGQARRLADDVVFLASGRITEHAGAASFFDAPQSDQARAYLSGHLVF